MTGWMGYQARKGQKEKAPEPPRHQETSLVLLSKQRRQAKRKKSKQKATNLRHFFTHYWRHKFKNVNDDCKQKQPQLEKKRGVYQEGSGG